MPAWRPKRMRGPGSPAHGRCPPGGSSGKSGGATGKRSRRTPTTRPWRGGSWCAVRRLCARSGAWHTRRRSASPVSAWARCLFDPSRAQDPIPSEERQMCAHDVDVEATQHLAWRVPREVAALFCAVRETVRSRLGAESGRFASDGEVFDAMLECALLAWTLRGARLHLAAEPARSPPPVPLRRGLRRAGEPRHPLRLPPPAMSARRFPADPGASTRRPGLRAWSSPGRSAAGALSLR